eukprot:CAMPEP_0179847526 /NCGR_PEP_ID=MMETSP0982-20121206/6129_1 /TAXON_ID=483367 /ORGANISM="non described non described, Strain CCMP 2436" /LENGTH=46 /DNA_ID= /DNA_START= /DNA_END= /DNA_ORIENTATION=
MNGAPAAQIYLREDEEEEEKKVGGISVFNCKQVDTFNSFFLVYSRI